MLVEYYNVSVRLFDLEDEFLGSGFFANESTIVTCAHVVKDCESVKVQMASWLTSFVTLKVVERNHAIDVAYIHLDFPLQVTDQFPPIIKIPYTDLEGLQCSVYGATEAYPNGGWTHAIVGRQINSYLVEGHQVGSGYAIQSGYSGSPVWLKDYKGIIGMIKGADEDERNFNFIIAGHISNYVKISCLCLDKIDFPRLPEKYFRIVNFYSTIVNTLSREDRQQSKMLVICGPSGIGKTTLVTDVFNGYEGGKLWIYAGIIDDYSKFCEKAKPLKKGDLIVIDDVEDNHPLVGNRWLTQELRCNIILSTKSKASARKIIDYNKQVNRKDYLYELTALPDKISREFLCAILDKEIDGEWMDKITLATKGYPLFIKIITDILADEYKKQNDINDSFFTDNQFFSSILNGRLSDAEVHELIFSKWLEQAEITQIHKDILVILSLITHIGISDKALLHIMVYSQEQLAKGLNYLRKKGFISINISPDGDEKIIVIHRCIAQIIQDRPQPDIIRFENKYVDYLKKGLSGQHNSEKGIVHRIDYLILQLKTLWVRKTNNEISPNDFIIGLKKHSEELDTILPHNCCSTAKSEWIGQLFQPIVSRDCRVLISIAGVIGRLNQCEVLAEMMWQTLTNIYSERPDALARMCVIVNAFSHWVRLEHIDKNYVLKKAKFHLDEIFRLNREDDNDKEVAVIIAGLCSLGLYAEALEITDRPEFHRQFRYSHFSYLMLSIALLKQDQYHAQIRAFIKDKFRMVYESEGKEDVLEYLKAAGFNFTRDSVRCPHDYYVNVSGERIPGVSRLISIATHDENFDKFVIKIRGTETVV